MAGVLTYDLPNLIGIESYNRMQGSTRHNELGDLPNPAGWRAGQVNWKFSGGELYKVSQGCDSVRGLARTVDAGGY